MVLAVLGINHKTVPLKVREQFAIAETSAKGGYRHLSDQGQIRELVVLSTCNRTELYAVLSSPEDREALKQMFLTLSGNSSADDEMFFYYQGEECIRHLFRVVSGIDSMVVGETGILNQVKEAYTLALAEKATRTILNTLFHRAITTGKRVRNETKISSNAVSVSYAAVKMAESILGTLEGKTALVFGAGDAAELLVKNLAGKGLRRVIVTNRHPERAEELAKKFHGETVPFHSAISTAEDVDIFVTATGASQYIVKAWDVRNLMLQRAGKPLVCIDIAVPSDIDPEVGTIRNVTLYDMDSLQEVVEQNIHLREGEAKRVEGIIEEELRSIMDRFTYLSTRPVMVSLSDKVEQIRLRILKKAISKISGLTEEDKRVLDTMSRQMARKILREPMIHLNEYAGTEWESEDMSAVTRLFGLSPDKEDV
ncbi:MAG: glutamyl-tRNA reductase [Dialister sp.]|nr:glutamyl-tRNA reductase [Dialister sp.]